MRRCGAWIFGCGICCARGRSDLDVSRLIRSAELVEGLDPGWVEIGIANSPKSESVGGGTLMRFGSLARSIVRRHSFLTAAVALMACPSFARAQVFGHDEQSAQPRATRQALFTTPVSSMLAKQKSPYVDAHGN